MTGVLSGGRQEGTRRSFRGWLVVTWLPVVVMLIAVAVESTHAFSSDNTSGWIRLVYQTLAGPVSDAAWSGIHHHIRKTGHFSGYGLLGLAWFRAWLLFWLQPMRFRPFTTWWRLSFVQAILCTFLVASLDELHQSFMPDRTGLMSDVLLDTAGAVTILLLTTLWAKIRSAHSGLRRAGDRG